MICQAASALVTHDGPPMAHHLKVNSHPHADCTGEIIVVHNGIIENFLELKAELQNLDHTFVSKTDTEVDATPYRANPQKQA